MSAHPPRGRHLLADLSGVAPERLSDPDALEALLRAAARAAGSTVLGGHFHPFGPGQGITGVLLLAESHISIHTWPEHGYAAVDLFLCGSAAHAAALAVLQQALQVGRIEQRCVARGQLPVPA